MTLEKKISKHTSWGGGEIGEGVNEKGVEGYSIRRVDRNESIGSGVFLLSTLGQCRWQRVSVKPPKAIHANCLVLDHLTQL